MNQFSLHQTAPTIVVRALELKIPPAILVLLFGFFMWLTARLSPGSHPMAGTSTLAAVVAAAGLTLAAAAAFSFRKARTTLNPTNPAASSALVTSGVFSHSRNPIYLAMLVILFAWVVHLGKLLPLGFLPLFVLYMNRFQIQPEERMLSRLFPGDFLSYKARVRRWI